LADRKPLERFLERALVRCDHARESRREFRAHRDFAFAFVVEIEKLIDNFSAALFSVEIGRLENRSVPFDEAITTRAFAPSSNDVVPGRTIVGQEISKTWERLHYFKNRKGRWARTTYAVE